MILFLDTTKVGSFLVGCIDGKGLLQRQTSVASGERRGDVLFAAIRRTFKKSNVDGIVVVSGPGHFSGVRHGVVAANALAYAKNIPVVGIERAENETDNALIRRGLLMIAKQTLNVYAVPMYGKEPNIIINNQSACR